MFDLKSVILIAIMFLMSGFKIGWGCNDFVFVKRAKRDGAIMIDDKLYLIREIILSNMNCTSDCCAACKHADCAFDKQPCCRCTHMYENNFEEATE